MAWPQLISPNYESLIVIVLARNHDHHFSFDDDEALLESLAREDEECRVIDGIGDPRLGQPPIPTQLSPHENTLQDVPPLKRSQKERGTSLFLNRRCWPRCLILVMCILQSILVQGRMSPSLCQIQCGGKCTVSFSLSLLYHISRGDPKGEIERHIELNQAETFIEQGIMKVVPQHDEILQRLRTTNGHAT